GGPTLIERSGAGLLTAARSSAAFLVSSLGLGAEAHAANSAHPSAVRPQVARIRASPPTEHFASGGDRVPCSYARKGKVSGGVSCARRRARTSSAPAPWRFHRRSRLRASA